VPTDASSIDPMSGYWPAHRSDTVPGPSHHGSNGGSTIDQPQPVVPTQRGGRVGRAANGRCFRRSEWSQIRAMLASDSMSTAGGECQRSLSRSFRSLEQAHLKRTLRALIRLLCVLVGHWVTQ
jgi:hypothetical protein